LNKAKQALLQLTALRKKNLLPIAKSNFKVSKIYKAAYLLQAVFFMLKFVILKKLLILLF